MVERQVFGCAEAAAHETRVAAIYFSGLMATAATPSKPLPFSTPARLCFG